MFYSSQTLCKSLVLTGSYPEIPDEPPEMCSWLWCVSSVAWVCVTSSRLCVGSGTGCLSGRLGSLLARHPLSAFALIPSGSVLSWIASVEPTCRHPAVSPTPEPSTVVFQVCCGTVILQSSLPSRLSVCLSLLAPRNRDSTSPYQQTLLGLPELTAQLELQSSSFALTHLFGYWQLNIQCSLWLWFHAHTLTIQLTVQVTASVAQ